MSAAARRQAGLPHAWSPKWSLILKRLKSATATEIAGAHPAYSAHISELSLFCASSKQARGSE
eukprot:6327505-Prymnesium_polylepis.1